MSTKNKIFFVYLLTLTATLFWLVLIFLAPYLRSKSSPLAGFLYALFSPTCHQIPSRCFKTFGYPLAVFTRCLGIYAGFLAGTLVYPVIRGFSAPPLPRVKILVCFSAPIVVDTAGNFLSIWSSSGEARFLTGFFWGIILPFYVLAGVTDCILRSKFFLKSKWENT